MKDRQEIWNLRACLMVDLGQKKECYGPEFVKNILDHHNNWFLNEHFDLKYAREQYQALRSYIFDAHLEIRMAFSKMVRDQAKIDEANRRQAIAEKKEREADAMREEKFKKNLREREAQNKETILKKVNDIVLTAEMVHLNVDDAARDRILRRITRLPRKKNVGIRDAEKDRIVDDEYIENLFAVIASSKVENINIGMVLAELPKEVIHAFSITTLSADEMLEFQRLRKVGEASRLTPVMVLQRLIEKAPDMDIAQAITKLSQTDHTKLQKMYDHADPVAVFVGCNEAQLKALEMYSKEGLTYRDFKDNDWFEDDTFVSALGYFLNVCKDNHREALSQLKTLEKSERIAIAKGMTREEVGVLKENALLEDFLTVYESNFLAESFRKDYRFFELNQPQQKAALKYADKFKDRVFAIAYFSQDWFKSDSHYSAFGAILGRVRKEHIIPGADATAATMLILDQKTAAEAAILEQAYCSSETDIRAQLMHDLQMYIERIQLTALLDEDAKVNFKHNFWFFKSSRAHNREANYQLAIQLRNELSKDGCDVKALFSDEKIKGLREKFNPTRGIHSSELNAVIQRARKLQ